MAAATVFLRPNGVLPFFTALSRQGRGANLPRQAAGTPPARTKGSKPDAAGHFGHLSGTLGDAPITLMFVH
jgi:hypothetical protein